MLRPSGKFASCEVLALGSFVKLNPSFVHVCHLVGGLSPDASADRFSDLQRSTFLLKHVTGSERQLSVKLSVGMHAHCVETDSRLPD